PKPLLFITGSSFVKASSSAHRFFHERADLCFGGGGQLLQGEGDRPHGAFVEVRLVAEAERRVPRLELVRALEEADDTVFGLIEPPSSTHSSALEDAQSRAQQPTCLRRAGLEALRYRTQGSRNKTPSPRRSRILQCVAARRDRKSVM